MSSDRLHVYYRRFVARNLSTNEQEAFERAKQLLYDFFSEIGEFGEVCHAHGTGPERVISFRDPSWSISETHPEGEIQSDWLTIAEIPADKFVAWSPEEVVAAVTRDYQQRIAGLDAEREKRRNQNSR